MYQERLALLDKTEAHIRGLLEWETMRVRTENSDQSVLFADEEPTEGERSVLSKFLTHYLADGTVRPLEDIKVAAVQSRIAFGEKNPGRVLHFALLGMAQNGMVRMVDKGKWQIAMATQ